MKDHIEKAISAMVLSLTGEKTGVTLSVPANLDNGDFTTNVAMKLSGKLGSPMEAGEKIIEEFRKEKLYSQFEKIELAKPGFINFYLSRGYIGNQIDELLSDKKEVDQTTKSLIFEFGDPNPFKEPHIGHVRNLVLGEAISRLLESQGYQVSRLDYQGDVGMHVAKALWGMIKLGFDTVVKKKLSDKAAFLGKAYAEGAKAYEEDENAKKEIVEINKKIYEKDQEILKLWKEGRQISLDYFEKLYDLLGIKYTKYYFESESAPVGLEIVKENTPKVFEEHDGAIIFRGEKVGLHTRVFVTGEGNPTYEAKDLGLAILKDKDFPNVDKSFYLTASEQTEYFKVMLAALSLVRPEIAGKTSHLSYGFVNLKEGKMSSRSGNIVPAFWLFEETTKRLKKGFPGAESRVLEDISIGAVKWSMLKFSRESNIAFDISESIQIEGNSGPYMQYAYARTSSLLEKSKKDLSEAKIHENLDSKLLALARFICQFELVKKSAAESFSPNILANYLFILAQNFNLFYEKEKVIGSADEDQKLLLVRAVGVVLKDGLQILGISSPEKI